MTKLVVGENDLASVDRELASQWHPTKNGDLSPRKVTAYSNKEAWWLGQCGHEWQAKISSRSNGRGCPYCSNKIVLSEFNDLATRYPKLLEEWDWDRNKELDPKKVLAGTHTYAWWKCSKCGHEWQAEIRMRSLGERGCPICAREIRGNSFRAGLLEKGKKSLYDEYPEIAKEWDMCKNAPKKPNRYTSNSNKYFWWKCSSCGYEWKASINNRVNRKSGCPLCAGNITVTGVNDLETMNSSLASEWHPSKNFPLKPSDVSLHSNEKVWWVCRFGHEYQCRIADRQNGIGCSECSKRFQISFPEKIVEYYIKQFYPEIISNYRPEFLSGAEIDIYIPSIRTGVEYDGQRYHQKTEKDKRKDMLCSENGITLIRLREPKCPFYERNFPTIIINGTKDDDFSRAIESVLSELNVPNSMIDVSRDKQIIMESFRNTAINGSILEIYPEIASEWHPTMNGGLKPENIPATRSKDRYYWKCSKCGYSWKADLSRRIAGSGCPACTGRVIVAGNNDLSTTHPLLAQEWHPTLNGNLTPQMVSKGQKTLVWWRCSDCGYEWKTQISKRVSGSGCERCFRDRQHRIGCKKVYQFSEEGEFIKEYDSAREASIELGISKESIQQVCQGKYGRKTAGGFIWKYTKNC